MSTTIGLNRLPHIIDIKIPAGDGFRQALRFKVDTGTSAPLNLTSTTFSLKVVPYKGAATSLLTGGNITAWTSSGMRVTTASSGLCTLNLANGAITSTTDDAYHEVVAAFGAGHPQFPSLTKTLIAGAVCIRADA